MCALIISTSFLWKSGECGETRIIRKFENQRETEVKLRASMADMKAYFKQRKKGSSSKLSSKKTPPPAHFASIGVDVVQPPALVTDTGSLDLHDERDENEEVLRQFDMSIAYGPCIGMTRLERWNRANKLGLNPPEEVQELLKSEKVRSECLWHSRV